MPAIKLTYFNGRGRAEHIRLILAYAGIKFEDKRIGFEDWPALKSKTPWGSLPMMEVDGKPLGQSLAIGRYAANVADITGKTAFDKATIDSAVDACIDMREMFVQWAFAKGDEEKAEYKKKMDDKVPVILGNLSKLLGKNKFFGVTKISWADIMVFTVHESLSSLYDAEFKKNAGLQKIVDAVGASPNIKKYIASRPKTDF